MVEELICAGLQCFSEQITRGIEALVQLSATINFSELSKSKERKE